MEEPEPPPLGWTIREAVAALLPDMLAAADGQPPPGSWMAGGGGAGYKTEERAALHRDFARIMEAGRYRATGMVKDQEQPIAPALWRAAKFGLGLRGDMVNRDCLFVGSKLFKGVRVNRPAFEDAGSTRAAPDIGGAAGGQAPGSDTEWWTACQTYTWVAFGEARKLTWWDDDGNERWEECIEFPRAKWSLDWKDHPRTGLSQAFIHIEEGRDWPADEWGGRGKDHCLAWARALMRDTGLDAGRLNKLLTAHNEQHARNADNLRQAWNNVMAAVRAGRLTIKARRNLPNGTPDISALPEILDPVRVFGPLAIGIRGNVDYAGGSGDGGMTTTSLVALFDYKGPRWDDAQFVAGQVQTLWPASKKVQPGILDWLTTAAEAYLTEKGEKPKRDALIQECVDALGVQHRDTKVAYAKLANHLRRTRGETGRKAKSNG